MQQIDLSKAEFKKSAKSSATGGCVGIADNLPEFTVMRNESDLSQGTLVFPKGNFLAFLEDAKAGKYDL